jgi:hypothetical protein
VAQFSALGSNEHLKFVNTIFAIAPGNEVVIAFADSGLDN